MYQYRRLSGKRNIRLLKLKYSHDDAQSSIEVEIEEHPLDARPKFEALSYTWADSTGDGTLSQRIMCNNGELREIPVTKNCKAALYRLRRADTDRTLWIDAICIDQTNKDEKAHQIPLMRDIYRSAEKVILWIGESTIRSDAGLQYIKRFASAARHVRAQSSDISEQPVYKELQPEMKAVYRSGDSQGELFTALMDIFYRSWWDRVWIIQEVALARNPTVVCGGTQCDYTDMEELNNALKESEQVGTYLTVITQKMSTQTQMRAYERGAKQPPWQTSSAKALHVLRLARRREATDDRDRVFGIQGLLQDAENVLPGYDPSKTTAEIYVDTARGLIEATRSLEVLCDCSGISGIVNLPNWAPDWSIKDQNAFKPSSFDAARESAAVVRFDSRSRGFISKGKVIDTLKTVTTHARPTRTTSVDQRVYDLDCIRAWREWLATVRHYFQKAPQESWNAFWRTLCWDSPPGLGGRAPESFGLTARPWRELLAGSMNESPEFVTYMMQNHPNAKYYYHRVRNGTIERSFAITDKVRMALVPSYSREGDVIAVLAGGTVPHVLRRSDKSSGSFTYVGSCYVHGIMDGEAFPADGELEEIVVNGDQLEAPV